MKKFSKSFTALLISLSTLIAACGESEPPQPTEAPAEPNTTSAPTQQVQGEPLVVTTVAPLTNIVSNIAGDCARVQGIIPEGTDSHTFEPRPSDTELLSRADLILVNGLNLEEPTLDLAAAAKPEDTEIYKLANNTISQQEWQYGPSYPESQGQPNPHLWVNPEYAESYARQTAEQLQQLAPQNAQCYESNLQAYLQRLDELDQVTQAVVESIPPENRQLLTYHDSWSYWAEEYGFEVIGAIQPSNFGEPSAQEVARLIDQIRQTEVPAIFGSEVFPSQVEEQIAREADVETANLSDDDLPGEGSANAMQNANPEHTYIGMMAQNLRALAENLGGNPELVDRLNTVNIVGPTAQNSQTAGD